MASFRFLALLCIGAVCLAQQGAKISVDEVGNLQLLPDAGRQVMVNGMDIVNTVQGLLDSITRVQAEVARQVYREFPKYIIRFLLLFSFLLFAVGRQRL
jgi:hypothetical protein